MGQGWPKEWSGPGMSKEIKWAKEAQDDMKTDPAEILANLTMRKNNTWQA